MIWTSARDRVSGLLVIGLLLAAAGRAGAETTKETIITGFRYPHHNSETGALEWMVSGERAHCLLDGAEYGITNPKIVLYGKGKTVIRAKEGTLMTVVKKTPGGVTTKSSHVLLKKGVTVETEDERPARLSTSSLRWDGETRRVSSEAEINITYDRFSVRGTGLEASELSSLITVRRNAVVVLEGLQDCAPSISLAGGEAAKPGAPASRITISSEGPLKLDRKGNSAVFCKKVTLVFGTTRLTTDLLTLSFDPEQRKARKLEARGGVRLADGELSAEGQEMVWDPVRGEGILSGRPLAYVRQGSLTSAAEVVRFSPKTSEIEFRGKAQLVAVLEKAEN